MEYNLSELKKKQVINTCNGKKLGKITDALIAFPSVKIINFEVGGAMSFSQENITILPCEIDKIGEDAILVKYNEDKKTINRVEYEE